MKKAVGLLLVLMLFLTSCDGTSREAEIQNTLEERTLKDTLIVAQGGDVTSLDPLLARNALSVTANQHIFDYLVFLSDQGEIIPGLAESWDFVSDTSIKFNIRKDVKFHNGDELTAEDVKYSFDRIIDSKKVAWAVDLLSHVEIVDKYTVIINLTEPFSGALAQFTRPGANIVPKKIVEADPIGFATNPVGTGPFKFVEWRQGDHIKLEANEDYWGKKTEMKYLTIRIIPEDSQRLIALENGEIDIAYDMAPSNVSKIAENSELLLLTAPSARTVYIATNLILDNPIAEKKVRQAMQYAINKEVIVNSVAYGMGQIAHTIIPPTAFGYTENIITKYDPEKAKALLAEAGYPNGFKTKLHTFSDQLYTEIAQVIQSQFLEIGIDLEIMITDQATLFEMETEPDHELVLESWLTVAADAHNTLYPYFHSTSPAAAGNFTFYNNPEVDKLLDQAKISYDKAERAEAYEKAQKILAEDLPIISIYYLSLLVGTSNNVEGFSINPYGYHRLDTVKVYKK